MDSLVQAVAEHGAYLGPAVAAHVLEQSGLSLDACLKAMIGLAQARACPPISHYRVGAAAQAESGALLLGYNLEFVGQPLHQSVHAEQFVVALAMARGERGLTRLALSVAPCGHCRQFLSELERGGELLVQIAEQPAHSLAELLPYRFGPSDLGQTYGLLAHPRRQLTLDEPGDALAEAALEAAARSYAPYSGCPAGVALEVEGEPLPLTGSYLENAAFNPSLSPLQAALVEFFATNPERTIRRAVLVEAGTGAAGHADCARSLLSRVAPSAHLEYRRAHSQIGQ